MRTTKTQGRKIEADREVVASGVPALVEPQTVIKDHRPCTAQHHVRGLPECRTCICIQEYCTI